MDPIIKVKFDAYPPAAQKRLYELRAIIFEVAAEKNLGPVAETLKWGEPSYATKQGSPVRIDWKAKTPKQVSIYFNCNSLLLETFKEIYGSELQTVGKREIILAIANPIPYPQIRGCLAMALQYHTLKKLPLLGAGRTDLC